MIKYFIFFGIALSIAGLSSSCNGDGKKDIKVTDLDSLVKLYPDSMPILLAHGEKMLKDYDYSKAIADAAKAFRKDSNNLKARMLYAEVLNNRPNRTFSDVLEAKRHFEVILKKEPKNPKALVNLATTYSQQQDFDKAFLYLNKALKFDPRYRDAYVLKGTMYLQLGNKELAKSSYETAVQQDPKFYEAYLILGTIYESENNPVCLEYYKTATQIQPKNPDVLYSLAYAYQNFDKLEPAKRLYRKMIQIDTNYHEALFQLGYIKHYKENDKDSAIYFYKSALKTNYKFVEAWHNLGMCYEELGDNTNALRSFSKALKYDPNFKLSKDEVEKIGQNYDPDKVR